MRHRTFATSLLALLASTVAAAQSPVTWPAAGRMSLGVEASLWWLKSSPTPVPLITDGYVGDPGTNVLLGGGSLDTNPNGGVRITAAYALRGDAGIEGSVFYVGSRSTSRSVSSTGMRDSIDLLLPFYDVTLGAENVTELSFSPIYAGSAREELQNDLWGAEINGAWALAPQGAWKLDVLAGVRYLRLRETYTFTTSSPYIPPEPTDAWNTTDSFDATNNFYGAQIGLRGRYAAGPWNVQASAKLALGAMAQSVNINGSLATNDFTSFGAVLTYPGGYLGLPSNSGDHSRNVFAAVPEVGFSVGYEVAPRLTLLAGYSFLYASDVVRPGQQINRNINPTQAVAYGGDPPAKPQGPAQPSFAFNNTSFWAQSVSLGIAYRF